MAGRSAGAGGLKQGGTLHELLLAGGWMLPSTFRGRNSTWRRNFGKDLAHRLCRSGVSGSLDWFCVERCLTNRCLLMDASTIAWSSSTCSSLRQEQQQKAQSDCAALRDPGVQHVLPQAATEGNENSLWKSRSRIPAIERKHKTKAAQPQQQTQLSHAKINCGEERASVKTSVATVRS